MEINFLNLTSGAIPNLDKRKEKNNLIALDPTLRSWVPLFQYDGLKASNFI